MIEVMIFIWVFYVLNNIFTLIVGITMDIVTTMVDRVTEDIIVKDIIKDGIVMRAIIMGGIIMEGIIMLANIIGDTVFVDLSSSL
jgi:hypothetical protein